MWVSDVTAPLPHACIIARLREARIGVYPNASLRPSGSEQERPPARALPAGFSHAPRLLPARPGSHRLPPSPFFDASFRVGIGGFSYVLCYIFFFHREKTKASSRAPPSQAREGASGQLPGLTGSMQGVRGKLPRSPRAGGHPRSPFGLASSPASARPAFPRAPRPRAIILACPPARLT